MLSFSSFRVFLGALLLSPVVASAQFIDVPQDHPHADAIAYVQGQGLVSGYPDGTFQPDRTLNRAEFTKIFVKATFPDQEPSTCDSSALDFPDVSAQNDWFAPYVCMAFFNGRVRGYPDGEFKPANTINFAEASKILTADIVDSTGSEPWYKLPVLAVEIRGAIPPQITSLDAPLTRGQIAEILFRYSTEHDKPSLKYEDVVPQPVVEAGPSVYIDYTQEAFGQLQDSGKAFAIFVHADWCPSCRLLETEILENLTSLPAGSTILKQDFDTLPLAMRTEYGITSQHTGILFNASGEYVSTVTGVTFEGFQSHLAS